MIISHLPAGYILTKVLQQRINTTALIWGGLLGSIFPDFDILYFYLIDGQQVFHHHYWTHLPLFWLSIACVAFPITRILGLQNLTQGSLFFFANIALHLCLDTLASPMYWLRPFANEGFQIFAHNIEVKFDFWVWNYMLHPVFAPEVLICGVASALWIQKNYCKSWVVK